MRLEFTGHSDDAVQIERYRSGNVDEEPETDEASAMGEGAFQASFNVLGPGKVCGECGHESDAETLAIVFAHFLPTGCWSFSISPVEEDKALPADWKVTTIQGHGYSTALVINSEHALGVSSGKGGKKIFSVPTPKSEAEEVTE